MLVIIVANMRQTTKEQVANVWLAASLWILNNQQVANMQPVM